MAAIPSAQEADWITGNACDSKSDLVAEARSKLQREKKEEKKEDTVRRSP